jgi:hypothetical protein
MVRWNFGADLVERSRRGNIVLGKAPVDEDPSVVMLMHILDMPRRQYSQSPQVTLGSMTT